MSFSVVSYNVLARSYIRPGRYPKSPPKALDDTFRIGLLTEQIVKFQAELYCLQEVEPALHSRLEKVLGASYQGVFAQRNGRPDGASIFIHRTHFALQHHEVLHFAAHEANNKQLALIAYVDTKEGKLALASTHLRWQPPGTSQENHLGRQQLLELLGLAETQKDYRWIVAGDFNALPESIVLAAAFAKGWKLSCQNQKPWDTTNSNGKCRKIDYLLYRPKDFRPSPQALPMLQPDTPLPSLIYPSDHLAVQVMFDWR